MQFTLVPESGQAIADRTMPRKIVMPPKSDGAIEVVRFKFSEEARSQISRIFDRPTQFDSTNF
jgi:hypothetical protein